MKSRLFNQKKGQVLEQFSMLATGIVGFTIVIIITLLILSAGRDQSISGVASTNVYNESVAYTNNTKLSLARECIQLTCNWIRNGTTPYSMLFNGTYSTGNYTCGVDGDTSDYLKITYINPLGSGVGSAVYVGYTCLEPNVAWNSTRTMTAATSDVVSWIPIILVVLIGGILLSLAMMLKQQNQ